MHELTTAENNMLKWHLGTIFSRRQPNLWIDAKDPKVWYFSTLGPEMSESGANSKNTQMIPLFAYKPTIDDHIHRVEFKTTEVYDLLCKAVPFAEDGKICFFVNILSTLINKKELHTIQYAAAEMSYIKEQGKDKARTKSLIGCKVDDIMFDHVVDTHDAVAKQFNEETIVFEREITDADLANSSVAPIDVHFTHNGKEVNVNLPFTGGLTCINAPSFPKQARLEGRLWCVGRIDQQCLKVVYHYETDHIAVTSLTPRALWFPDLKS